jgi:hypothetical protein
MGLDLSLRGAAAVVLDREGNRLVEKRFGYALTEDATERDHIERLIDIVRGIVRVAKEWLVRGQDAIVIEGYAFNRWSKSSSMTQLAELHGLTKVQLHLEGYTDPVYVRWMLG